MNHMTTYLKNKVIKDNLVDQAVYVGLFTPDGEVTATGYARQKTTFSEGVEGQTTNNVDILFPIATELWGEIVNVGLFDAATNGNVLFKAPAEFKKTIDVSSQYKIPNHYLIVRLR